jgi:putative transposase
LSGSKKNLRYSAKEIRKLIEPGHPEIPIYRQCELLGLSRSGYYYRPHGESELNLELMNLIDGQYTKMPFYGVEKMTEWLKRQGYTVNPKRVRRLMRLMGLEAIYPKKQLSIPSEECRKYPYLLRNLVVERPDHVWCADITYIRMLHGFLYLVAIMDWYSRYVLTWQLSNTLDVLFCIDALEGALAVSRPEIFNSDQGVQFTSNEFTRRLDAAGVRISMDGRGRVFDNIFIERLWRSVKYEEVYLHSYESVREARDGLSRYFRLYNTERLHEALGYRTPYEVYFGGDRNNNRQAGLIHLKEACFLS